MPNTTITFAVSFDGTPEESVELLGYLFDARDKLIASAPVRDGKAVFDIDAQRLGRARLFIAPKSANLPGSPTVDMLKRAGSYEPALRLDPATNHYTLKPILAEMWRRWILCVCHVPGRVVRPIELAGHVQDLPVYHARVHLCEVDRIPILLARIPDSILLKLREELLRVWPPIPGPPPELRQPIGPRLSLGAFAQPEVLNRVSGLDLTPERLDELADTQPDLVATALRAATAAPAELPANVRTAIATASPVALRESFERHFDQLLPYFCLMPRIWPFLRRQEVFTALTDEHGRFDARILYPCRGDKPDIYVWVEYCIGGVWTPVYKPPVACSTRWNYPSGQELIVRIRDPRVPWYGDPPHMPGSQIGVITLGNGVSVSQIDADGLAPGGRPLGGSLEPTVWFGPGLLASGITHYRWSYRRLSDAGVALEDWHACDAFVGRHYAEVTPDERLIFRVFKLGPDETAPGTLYKLPPPNPPIGTWAPQLNARSNTASAYFVSGTPTGRQVPDGLYELKLELFRVTGSTLSLATGLDFRVPPSEISAPFTPEVEVSFVAASEANLIRDSTGHVAGYVMRLRVDNSTCTAGIYGVTVPGSTQECGFVAYPQPVGAATLRFLAMHPHGHADFDFTVWRGSCGVGFAAASGKTGASPVNGYALDAAAVYARSIPIDALLAPLSGMPACMVVCKRAAFAQHLHVYARATDGWSRLEYLDAHAVAAFALAPKE